MASVVRLFLFAGVVGAGVAVGGMEFFLFRFNDSHPLHQMVWFLLMLVWLLGAALYWVMVYARSNASQSA
jgi:hypothetical protein